MDEAIRLLEWACKVLDEHTLVTVTDEEGFMEDFNDDEVIEVRDAIKTFLLINDHSPTR